MRASIVWVCALCASCAAPETFGCVDGTLPGWHGDCEPYMCDRALDCGGIQSWVDDPGIGCEQEMVCVRRSYEGDEGSQMPTRVEACPHDLGPMEGCSCSRAGICRHSRARAIIVRALECALALALALGLVFVVRRMSSVSPDP